MSISDPAPFPTLALSMILYLAARLLTNLAIPETLLLSLFLVAVNPRLPAWLLPVPAQHITAYSSLLNPAKLFSRDLLLQALVSLLSFGFLCLTSSGARTGDIREADLVNSVSHPIPDSISQPIMESEREASPSKDFSQPIAALTHIVQKLQADLSRMEDQLSTDTVTLPLLDSSAAKDVATQTEAYTSSGTYPILEPRVPVPERFSGDRRKFRTFRNACKLYFSLLPQTFSTQDVRVGFVISLLLDEPQSWAFQLREQLDPALASMDSFFSAMSQLYADPFCRQTAEQELSKLQQGQRPVEDYVTDFRLWSTDTEWNQAALHYQFRLGLSDPIKDELARVEVPSVLEDLIKLVILIDRRLRERQSERTHRDSPHHRTKNAITCLSSDMTGSPRAPSRKSFLRSPLSAAERLRRQHSNLCLYCGDIGHYLQSCPVRPHKSPTNWIHTMHPPGPDRVHLTLPCHLQLAEKTISVSAIIDSGACSCFVDSGFAARHDLPLCTKKQGFVVHLADGSGIKSGPVTQETVPILCLSSASHQEFLRLDVISSPMFPIILGMPWLKAHNPSINWLTGEVLFSSPYCLVHCVPHEVRTTTPLLAIQSDPETSKLVPAVYHDFLNVFNKKNADSLPPHRAYDCPIELLPGAEIPFGRIYPLSEPELEALRHYIDENLEKGFIRHSTSPAGAGIFFVEKKDHTLRPCVDYRDLNKITVKNRYPLPLIPELFQRLRGAQVFSKLDLRGAYNLIRIRNGDEWKTAFRTRFGHYEYLVMPFGLCNAPATFQHLVNDIFRDYLDLFIIVYLDDILIFSSSLDLHRGHVKKVLERLRQHHLYAKAEKCDFERSSIQFLGLVISAEGISMDPQKVAAVLDWPAPEDKKAIQRFVGFANFYRKFIKNFSGIIAPVTQLTKQHVSFKWTPEAQDAFEKLKTLFTSAPILRHPDPSLAYVLEVDASETAVGAILSQRQGAKSLLHPIAFFSRKLNSSEKNYDVGDRELLAIKAALEEWRYLLEGAAHPILIFTDHKNLEYLRTAKRLRPRQARWALFFSRFTFHLTFRPGSKNGKPDALSRMFSESTPLPEPDTILPAKNFLLLQADVMSQIKEAVANHPPPLDLHLQPRDELFFHKEQIFIPEQFRVHILKKCHDHPLAGHFGIHKTSDLVSRSFWWPNLLKDCRDYVRSCSVCLRNKSDRAKTWGLLESLPVPEKP